MIRVIDSSLNGNAHQDATSTPVKQRAIKLNVENHETIGDSAYNLSFYSASGESSLEAEGYFNVD